MFSLMRSQNSYSNLKVKPKGDNENTVLKASVLEKSHKEIFQVVMESITTVWLALYLRSSHHGYLKQAGLGFGVPPTQIGATL